MFNNENSTSRAEPISEDVGYTCILETVADPEALMLCGIMVLGTFLIVVGEKV